MSSNAVRPITIDSKTRFVGDVYLFRKNTFCVQVSLYVIT